MSGMLNNIKKVIKLSSNSAEGMNVSEGRRGLITVSVVSVQIKVLSSDNSEVVKLQV